MAMGSCMKGIASRNSLKALAHPVQQFVAGWGAGERANHSGEGAGGTELPAPYELAALRGEAVLRERFFGATDGARCRSQLDAVQQVALWHEIWWSEGGLVTAWVQRLGIAKALRREAVIAGTMPRTQSRKLYTLLAGCSMRQQAPELLPWAVEGYFWHCWKARFPETPAQIAKKAAGDVEALRERLVQKLRRQYGEPVEVKESFLQEERTVRFALLAKRKSVGRWEELVRVERGRLNSARMAGYSTALEAGA